jgi:hypothetical protein
VASRLSTVGNAVLDGNGLAVSEGNAVSVRVAVGVAAVVPVAVGRRGVSVAGANEVFVGNLVSTDVDGIAVGVRLQAKEVRIHKSRKRGFRLICEILLYPNDTEVRKFWSIKKDPRPGTGIFS